jgi:hypothetical protein
VTFLYPGFLIAGGLVSLGVVILHLLVTQPPQSEQLPTVRFIPDVPAQSTSLTVLPSDLLLMVLRIITIMLIAMAFAQPQLKPQHQTIVRITMIDASRSSASAAELTDSARKYVTGAAAVVVFDSAAREVIPGMAMDTISVLMRTPHVSRQGALSAAMIVGMRAAARVRTGADSIDFVIVSPLLAAERDAATMSIRQLWPGHVHVVRVAPLVDSATARSTVAAKVEWADLETSSLWTQRAKIDTMNAVRAGDNVLISTFPRRWTINAKIDSVTRVFARWADGDPAGVEQFNANGCVHSLGFSMPSSGDVALRPDFIRFTSALRVPCGAAHDLTPLPSEFVTALEGPARLAPVSMVKPPLTRLNPWMPWLLLAAFVLALLELLVRRLIGNMAVREAAALAADAVVRNARKSGRAA